MKAGTMILLSSTAVALAIAGVLLLRAPQPVVVAATAAPPAASNAGKLAAIDAAREARVRAQVIAYDPLVRADVVAYDDLSRAYATSRCGRGLGPCPGDQAGTRRLSSREATIGY